MGPARTPPPLPIDPILPIYANKDISRKGKVTFEARERAKRKILIKLLYQCLGLRFFINKKRGRVLAK